VTKPGQNQGFNHSVNPSKCWPIVDSLCTCVQLMFM